MCKDPVHSKYALLETHFLQRYWFHPGSKKEWTDSASAPFSNEAPPPSCGPIGNEGVLRPG